MPPSTDSHDPDSDPAGEHDSSHPHHRVGDLISGEVPDEQLDAHTLAELAAWFGGPPPAEETQAQERTRLQRDNLVRIAEAVDPALLATLEARARSGDALRRSPEEFALTIERPIAKFRARTWRLDIMYFSGEHREREVPADVAQVIEEHTPQSLLRDLHRPELHWEPIRVHADPGPQPVSEPYRAQIQDALGERPAAELAKPSAPEQARAELSELRARLAEPWQPVHDDAPAVSGTAPGAGPGMETSPS